MAISRANHELVSVAWLKQVTGLNSVATSVPENSGDWYSTGFIQPVIVSSDSHIYYELRSCVFVAHVWTARQNISAQSPPWSQANEISEQIVKACYEPSLYKQDSLSLPNGAPSVRVLQAALIEDPMRAPSDDTHMAHFTTSVQIWWVEKP